jgi:hypothetical protein
VILHSQRKRRAARDALEADGERLWSEDVPAEARVKIAGFWQLIPENVNEERYHFALEIATIMRLEGGYNFESVYPDTLIRAGGSDFALDLIGAACLYVSRSASAQRYSEEFENFINDTLEDFRVAYRVVDHEVIPIDSDELHAEVVAPALRLLVGKQFANAHVAYLEAIKEIPANPANAITDAGVALQETLSALGCNGNALGSLIADGKKRGLLAAHDATLTTGIVNFLNWASADRSEKGDGHHVTDASRSDAWLMVHVVGALIVRLVSTDRRAASS